MKSCEIGPVGQANGGSTVAENSTQNLKFKSLNPPTRQEKTAKEVKKTFLPSEKKFNHCGLHSQTFKPINTAQEFLGPMAAAQR
jgi:hypothetical protein